MCWWRSIFFPPSPAKPGEGGTVRVAVVGLGAHFGPWPDRRSFQERALGGDAGRTPQTAPDRPRPGYFIDELRIPLDQFRIPPAELRETLPQQLLMLRVAAEALADAGGAADPGRTGAFIGLGLDLNTTNFHFRWSRPPELRDAAGPPLTANHVMGSLGSIAASRIARAFDFGGPCFTLCSEETSGARALEMAVRALQRGEIELALVGAVDLAGDPRVLLTSPPERTPGEGAAALVLMRLDDAVRAGKHVYAVIEGVGVATGDADAARQRAEAEAGAEPSVVLDAEGAIGHAGAAAALASVAQACLALDRQILSAPCGPQFWLHDRADGPRRAAVRAESTDGNRVYILLAEHEPAALEATPERVQPLGALSEAIFLLDGDTPADLLHGLDALRRQTDGRPLETLARRWWHDHRPVQSRRLGLALVARDADELREQIDFAAGRLGVAPEQPILTSEHTGPVGALRDRVFYTPRPLGPAGALAFVYPGSGNHYPGMGRQLGVAFPDVLRRQQSESRFLRGQFAPHLFWDGDRSTAVDPQAALFGQVCHGGLVSDVLAAFGVRPAAAIGYSLGESAALFGLRAWRDRDEMFRRMRASSLFVTDLAGPCDSARAAWGLPPGEPADWLAGVLARPADAVRAALPQFPRTYLLIVNTPGECVIGGQRPAVEALARHLHLGGRFHPLDGVTIAHCDIVRQVAPAYRELHRLPTAPPAGVRFYSGATGRAYVPDTDSAADAILGHASATLDFPRLIENAYADGVRLFVEVGPGPSCRRMIGEILGERPHLARSACVAQQDEVSTLLRLLARLHAERAPVDLGVLYGGEGPAAEVTDEAAVVVPVGRLPFRVGAGKTMPSPPSPLPQSRERGEPSIVPAEHGGGFFLSSSPLSRLCGRGDGGEGRAISAPAAAAVAENPIPALAAARVAATQAHETFLRFTAATHRHFAGTLAFQTALLEQLVRAPEESAPLAEPRVAAARQAWLDRAGCLAFAVGKVGPILGPAFAPIDEFPTRVRLPDEPLMLVDRITEIEAEPLSLTHGRLVTEHDVYEGRWYLDNGHIPPSIAIESGQADLFLSGYLGIDFQTRGLAVYRLLDAAVTFHRGLPGPGATVRYDIHIERFFRQGDTHLFRFRFDGTVDGEPLLTMRDGCAGFFTAEELAAGKGVVLTELERRPQPGTLPPDWRPLAPLDGVESFDAAQLDALRQGDLAGGFGPAFAGLPLREPLTLPDADKLRLIDRVTRLDPRGGRYGLGQIRAEADIRPDDWFLTCHFVDDQVMPGTLMYECCLHTLRVFLLRLGWVGERADCVFEPVPGVASRLKCRGQVTAATRTVAYEVSVKELGYGPEPFAIADALMFADGKPIVDVRNLTLRLTGGTRQGVQGLWSSSPTPASQSLDRGAEIFTRPQILAFATGNPSEAFGARYRPFDAGRFIARLPAPPYSFLDRVLWTDAEAWTMKAGGSAVVEYDVPPGAWYFAAARQPAMPYAVLLEVALQACGWMSAYLGSALHSDTDLHYRNLGGTAVQLAEVGPDAGTLTTRVKITKVSKSAGMIIQHFDFEVCFADGRPVYRGDTYFGFFSAASLAQQVGLREATPYQPTAEEQARGERFAFPAEPPFPDAMLRMVDAIDLFVPDGGPHGLGFVRGSKAVDPGEWFFQAHFHQDPVWPGSLGLESFLQLLQVVAERRWGVSPAARWQVAAHGVPHTWVYRGQVAPGDRCVTVQAEVTTIDDTTRTVRADGYLLVDGRTIYHMKDFALRQNL